VEAGGCGYHPPVAVDELPRSEADDATRGSAVKLAAEVVSRLLAAAMPFLVLRRLGAAEFGRFGELQVVALLVAELGELGLSNLASRALVAGTATLGSFLRARLLASALVGLAALAAVPLAPVLDRRAGSGPPDGVGLALLIAWFALSGWAEFLGVALRCRGARRHEALVLLALRSAAPASVAAVLLGGAGLPGVCGALALSPLPAIALGALLLRSTRPAASAPAVPATRVLRESAPLAVHGALLLLSPRVEFLVLSSLRHGSSEVGFFYAALNVVWPLGMVPAAVTAGAMPALTREAGRRLAGADRTAAAGGSVRARTAATLALLGAPAAVGLALVAPELSRLLLRASAGQALTASTMQIAAAAVPALFQNAVVASALIAVGRARWLPWLTAARVAFAFALASLLVPLLGARGAAAGFVAAEWLLLALGSAACRRAGFAVPVARPLVWSLLACVPMALAVSGVAGSLPAALAIGGLTWAATLAAAARLKPALVRQLTGDLRYP